MLEIPPYTVIRDTREKTGWWFDEPGVCETVVGTLKTGDYSIRGLERLVCVERKANAAELAGNLTRDAKRFHAELRRMESFQYAVIACGFPLSHVAQYPQHENMHPRIKARLKMDGEKLMSRLIQIQEKFKYVDWVFDKRAEDRALRFLSRVWAAHCRGELPAPTAAEAAEDQLCLVTT